MDLSVIIVSYNVRYFLEQCLQSVMKAMEGIPGEIFVVDNASSDESCSMTEQKYPGVKLIRNKTNIGFSAANNLAIDHASGKYILLLNPDTLVAEDSFSRCLAFMKEHPDAGALGVRMIDGNGRFLPESKRSIPTPATAFYRYTGLWRLFPGSKTINRYYVGDCGEMETSAIEVISGAFMLISREAIHKTGKLDEDYFMYGEDIDYCYRLLRSGFRNYYFPGASIIHFKGESTEKEKLNVVVNFYKAMLIFIRKHLSGERGLLLIFSVRSAVFLTAGLSFFKRKLWKLAGRSSVKSKKYLDGNRVYKGLIDGARDLEKIRLEITASKAEEIIFPLGDMNISKVIEVMSAIKHHNIRMRFMSHDRKYLTGSGFTSTNPSF